MECFERATRRKITEATAVTLVHESPRSFRAPMGLILLSRGILSPAQLRQALDKQRSSGMSIGDALQDLGFATPEQVTAAVASQWACPVYLFQHRPVTNHVRIPRRLLERYELLPVHYRATEHKLLVGFVRCVHYRALRTIEQMISSVAVPCFITAKDYKQHLCTVAPGSPDFEIVFDRPTGSMEMAQFIRNYAQQLGADVVRLGTFVEYLWVRLWGRGQELDLLFKMHSRLV